MDGVQKNLESLNIGDDSIPIQQNLESLNISDDSNPDDLVYPQAPVLSKRVHSEHTYFRPEHKGPVKPKRPKIIPKQSISDSQDAIQIDEQYKIEDLDKIITENTGDKNAQVMIFNKTTDDDTLLSYSDIPNKPEPEKWYKAHADELLSLKKNKTWRLVDGPLNRNIIGSRTIYRCKRDKTGKLVKRKARVVA